MAQHMIADLKDRDKQVLADIPVKHHSKRQDAPNALNAGFFGGSSPQNAAGLQKILGNQAVQRMVETVQRKEEDGQVGSHIEAGIDQARGGGRPLDSTVQASMENSFGTDFSGVRIHTGSHADILNRSLSAKAFTTGRDIFFKDGNYNPGSSAGRELLAHELTHVVQQSEEIRPKLTLGGAGDKYETEADSVARDVMRQEDVQLQPEEEEEPVQARKNMG